MARYLVTGGAGFIGSHIVAELVLRNHWVRILDNFSSGRRSNVMSLLPHVDLIEGDLRDFDTVRKAANGVDVVFHEGALPSVPRSIQDPLGSLATNVQGTQHVLIAARETGVRRVVYASSSSVYGDTPVLPKQEDMTPHPLSPYAVQKLTGEQLCAVWTRLYGLETVALRYFNVFGPRQNPASQYAAVIPSFLHSMLTKQRPIVFGDGEQSRDFTYVSNVVEANLLAADAPDAAGQAINIGCEVSISLNMVLGNAAELLGGAPEAEYRDARAGDVRDSRADITRARELLGYEPKTSFHEGLRQTLKALQAELEAASLEDA